VYIGVERNHRRQALDDRTPNDVLGLVQAVDAALSRGLLRSVSQVVIGWDDVMTVGEPPGQVLYAFRRRSQLVAHPDPRDAGPYSPRQLEFGATVTASVDYAGVKEPQGQISSQPIDTHDAVIAPTFIDSNRFPQGVRESHAIEAIAEPDDVARYHVEDIEIAFVTREIPAQDHPYVLLVIATQKVGEKFQVINGYRLYRSEDGLDLKSNAFHAFRLLLERYGLEVAVGDQRGLFIPMATAAPGAGVAFAEGSGSYFLSALAMRLDNGCTRFAGVFAVDSTKYRAAIHHRRS
jgi:hypothetical protein